MEHTLMLNSDDFDFIGITEMADLNNKLRKNFGLF